MGPSTFCGTVQLLVQSSPVARSSTPSPRSAGQARTGMGGSGCPWHLDPFIEPTEMGCARPRGAGSSGRREHRIGGTPPSSPTYCVIMGMPLGGRGPGAFTDGGSHFGEGLCPSPPSAAQVVVTAPVGGGGSWLLGAPPPDRESGLVHTRLPDLRLRPGSARRRLFRPWLALGVVHHGGEVVPPPSVALVGLQGFTGSHTRR